MAIEVLGVGFGRTGTTSLKQALEELGYDPCHHMEEVFKHPEEIAHWHGAALGRPTDWQALLGPYKAAIDWPSTFFWRDLIKVYPEAKVILTLRDPESWWNSFSRTVAVDYQNPPPEDPGLRRWYDMVEEIIANQTFQSQPNDRDTAIAAFKRHIAEVQAEVPADRLLVFEARQGWAPLCDFLDLPVPDRPYPNRNSTQEFIDAQGERRAGMRSA